MASPLFSFPFPNLRKEHHLLKEKEIGQIIIRNYPMTPMNAGFAIAVAESVAAPASGCTSDNYGYILSQCHQQISIASLSHNIWAYGFCACKGNKIPQNIFVPNVRQTVFLFILRQFLYILKQKPRLIGIFIRQNNNQHHEALPYLFALQVAIIASQRHISSVTSDSLAVATWDTSPPMAADNGRRVIALVFWLNENIPLPAFDKICTNCIFIRAL